MENNKLLAMQEIATAESEIDVFHILDKYKIDHYEGQLLIDSFNRAQVHRQKALDERNQKLLEMKIERLKKKHDYLKDLTNEQIEYFYEHLLYEKKEDDKFNTRYEDLVHECAIRRGMERKQRKQKQLNVTDEPLICQSKGIAMTAGFGSDEDIRYSIHRRIVDTVTCPSCDHLLECNC
ncbi:hypothetical protein ABEY41_19135 [Peribacillus butanolivorans]|uniref:hypothetical protein n=1 Tax=Peribacillus butanolivorans TaxID=421767 RepID=UPI003D297AA8